MIYLVRKSLELQKSALSNPSLGPIGLVFRNRKKKYSLKITPWLLSEEMKYSESLLIGRLTGQKIFVLLPVTDWHDWAKL